MTWVASVFALGSTFGYLSGASFQSFFPGCGGSCSCFDRRKLVGCPFCLRRGLRAGLIFLTPNPQKPLSVQFVANSQPAHGVAWVNINASERRSRSCEIPPHPNDVGPPLRVHYVPPPAVRLATWIPCPPTRTPPQPSVWRTRCAN